MALFNERGYLFTVIVTFGLKNLVLLALSHLPNTFNKIKAVKYCYECLKKHEWYIKEYGKDILCLPKNENYEGKNFYFVDDVLATGGTLKAAEDLIKKAKGNFVGAGVYINIKALNNLDVNSVENQ